MGVKAIEEVCSALVGSYSKPRDAPVDDDLAQASNITLHAGQLSSRSAGESMSGTDLIRVLLLTLLGEGREGKDPQRQSSAEQPHGLLRGLW